MSFLLTSSVTLANASTILEQGLAAIAAGQTELDLAPLTEVDSTMVAILLSWQRAAQAQGTALSLQNIPAKLQSLAGVYGVAELLIAPHRH